MTRNSVARNSLSCPRRTLQALPSGTAQRGGAEMEGSQTVTQTETPSSEAAAAMNRMSLSQQAEEYRRQAAQHAA
eukprot:COSAG02_NODE_898_length_16108_cov_5.877444_18_plen_75_part_00